MEGVRKTPIGPRNLRHEEQWRPQCEARRAMPLFTGCFLSWYEVNAKTCILTVTCKTDFFLTDWHNRDNWSFNSTTCLHTQGCNLTCLILYISGSYLVQKINDWYTLLVHEQWASPQDVGTLGCFLTLQCYVRSQIKSTHTCQDIMVLCFTTSN